MMTPTVDVVTVADFDGQGAALFELLVLLFLGAWMGHEGASRGWPLHLACIGPPPGSVRRLAEEAGASITVHQPLLFNELRTSNKLRGFDVHLKTGRVLLLDTDILVLHDLSPLAIAVGEGVGVGVATINHLPQSTWRQVYSAVHVRYPGPSGTCWCADRAIADRRRLDDAQRALCLRTPPFFNSGVVLAPPALGALWREDLARIVRHFQDHPAHWPRGRAVDDEHALAIATEQMRLAAVPVVTIPPRFHARPLLLRAGVIQWPEVALFHYHTRLKSVVRTVSELEPLLLAQLPMNGQVGPGDLTIFGPFYDRIRRIFQEHVQRVWPAGRSS